MPRITSAIISGEGNDPVGMIQQGLQRGLQNQQQQAALEIRKHESALAEERQRKLDRLGDEQRAATKELPGLLGLNIDGELFSRLSPNAQDLLFKFKTEEKNRFQLEVGVETARQALEGIRSSAEAAGINLEEDEKLGPLIAEVEAELDQVQTPKEARDLAKTVSKLRAGIAVQSSEAVQRPKMIAAGEAKLEALGILYPEEEYDDKRDVARRALAEAGELGGAAAKDIPRLVREAFEFGEEPVELTDWFPGIRAEIETMGVMDMPQSKRDQYLDEMFETWGGLPSGSSPGGVYQPGWLDSPSVDEDSDFTRERFDRAVERIGMSQPKRSRPSAQPGTDDASRMAQMQALGMVDDPRRASAAAAIRALGSKPSGKQLRAIGEKYGLGPDEIKTLRGQ